MLPMPVWPEQCPLLHPVSSTKAEALVDRTTAMLQPATLPIANSLNHGSTESLFLQTYALYLLNQLQVKR